MANTRIQVLLNDIQRSYLEKRVKKLGMSHSMYFKYAMLAEAIISGDKKVLETLGQTFRYDQIVRLNKFLDNFNVKNNDKS